jgi:uncharacterized protein (TIGR03382 family)
MEWVGPRWDKGVGVIDVKLDDRSSFYSHYGDGPAALCLLFTGAMAVVGWRRRNDPLSA